MADAHAQDAFLVLVGVACAVDARHRRDDHDVATAAHQRRHRRKPQFVDFLVDHQVFLDVRPGGGDERLGLVVVVVADEVLDGVIRKKLLELAVELRGQGFVMAQHQRGAVDLLDDVSDGEGFAGTRHAEQRLGRFAVAQALHELLDGLGLVAGGDVFGSEFEVHGGLRESVA